MKSVVKLDERVRQGMAKYFREHRVLPTHLHMSKKSYWSLTRSAALTLFDRPDNPTTFRGMQIVKHSSISQPFILSGSKELS